jgi:type II secretory ATPase GspE/PulE/Tfp pilus assembly ATPase PilB-like protein
LPHPQLLQQLGLPQTHVQELYQQYQPNPAEMGEIPPCPQCDGRGFKGRIGLFELLEVNNQIAQAIISQPNPATFHQIAEQSGMVSMRQDGVVQLAQGTTSMQELQRALA